MNNAFSAKESLNNSIENEDLLNDILGSDNEKIENQTSA